jgi:hypothetical protein
LIPQNNKPPNFMFVTWYESGEEQCKHLSLTNNENKTFLISRCTLIFFVAIYRKELPGTRTKFRACYFDDGHIVSSVPTSAPGGKQSAKSRIVMGSKLLHNFIHNPTLLINCFHTLNLEKEKKKLNGHHKCSQLSLAGGKSQDISTLDLLGPQKNSLY